MSHTFKNTAQKFVTDVMAPKPEKPILKLKTVDQRTYKDEKKLSEFGKKKFNTNKLIKKIRDEMH